MKGWIAALALMVGLSVAGPGLAASAPPACDADDVLGWAFSANVDSVLVVDFNGIDDDESVAVEICNCSAGSNAILSNNTIIELLPNTCRIVVVDDDLTLTAPTNDKGAFGVFSLGR